MTGVAEQGVSRGGRLLDGAIRALGQVLDMLAEHDRAAPHRQPRTRRARNFSTSSRAMAGVARKTIWHGGLPTSSDTISKRRGARTTTRDGASANDSTRAVTDMARGSKKEPTGARLRIAWRKAARALTRPEPAPQPEKRRRREEGVGRYFARAAKQLTRWPRPRDHSAPAYSGAKCNELKRSGFGENDARPGRRRNSAA